jgi:hypothetical protein
LQQYFSDALAQAVAGPVASAAQPLAGQPTASAK